MNNIKHFLKDFLINLSIRLYLKKNSLKIKKELKDDQKNLTFINFNYN